MFPKRMGEAEHDTKMTPNGLINQTPDDIESSIVSLVTVNKHKLKSFYET